jgi:hypothetical protein
MEKTKYSFNSAQLRYLAAIHKVLADQGWKSQSSLLYFDREGIPIDLFEWQVMHGDEKYVRVKLETLPSQVEISTVWVGIAHDEKKSGVFETRTSVGDQQIFYKHSSEQEAREMHERIKHAWLDEDVTFELVGLHARIWGSDDVTGEYGKVENWVSEATEGDGLLFVQKEVVYVSLTNVPENNTVIEEFPTKMLLHGVEVKIIPDPLPRENS